MNKEKVCIILLTYNNFVDTKECLESLKNLDYENHEIVLIDNGSTDNSLEKIDALFPKIKKLVLKKNLGVPAGFNLGIHYAITNDFDSSFILNNDTIVAPNIISELIKIKKLDTSCGLVMPQILYYPPKINDTTRKDIWSDGGYFRNFPPGIVQKDTRKNINFNAPRTIEYAPACGILVPLQTFFRVGLFDAGYFYFFEDWDFSERIRKAGLNIWCAPEAKLWHKVSVSTKRHKNQYWYVLGKSTIRFYRRHYSFISAFFQVFYRVVRDFIFMGNIKYINDYLKGIISGFKSKLNNYPSIKDYNPPVDILIRRN